MQNCILSLQNSQGVRDSRVDSFLTQVLAGTSGDAVSDMTLFLEWLRIGESLVIGQTLEEYEFLALEIL
jgi:hypothetical protein